MAKVGIYGIYDTADNTCLYVGQSRDMPTRWRQHCYRMADGKGLPQFVEWYASIGCDRNRLRFAVLEEVENLDLLNQKEIHWFNKLKPCFYGRQPSEKDKFGHREEVRAKIAASVTASYESRLMDRDLICGYCKEIFHSGRRNKMFCSRKHRALSQEKGDTLLICRLRRQGLTLDQIAKEVGASAIAVRKRLINHACAESCTSPESVLQ